MANNPSRQRKAAHKARKAATADKRPQGMPWTERLALRREAEAREARRRFSMHASLGALPLAALDALMSDFDRQAERRNTFTLLDAFSLIGPRR